MVQIEIKMIGNKIAEARKKAGLSQAQLSQHLFISPQAVGKWERGESIPDIITFHKMAEILGVDLYFFLDMEKGLEKMEEKNEEEKPVLETPKEKGKKKPIWDMSRGNWVDADFSGLNNLHEKFNGSNMQNCKFVGSDLSGLQLKYNNIQNCDFSNTNISESCFQGSNIQKTDFKESTLKKTKLSATNLENCDFSQADLSEATFKHCNISKSKFAQAFLNQTFFNDSTFEQIVFEGVVEDCSFENCSFSKVTFQNTTLINTFFKGRNLKRITFVNCKADRLTYEFLRTNKADLDEVTINR
jgi:transcriptional regulator with XRE-family HTH domain